MATPYKCPICNGKATVPAGFYSNGPINNTLEEPCRSCEKGIIWDREQEEKSEEKIDLKKDIQDNPWKYDEGTWRVQPDDCLIPKDHEGPIWIYCPCHRCSSYCFSIPSVFTTDCTTESSVSFTIEEAVDKSWGTSSVLYVK